MHRVGIVGATGYTGSELIRLLIGIPLFMPTEQVEVGLPPSVRFPPLREGNRPDSVPPARRGNLQEGVVNPS